MHRWRVAACHVQAPCPGAMSGCHAQMPCPGFVFGCMRPHRFAVSPLSSLSRLPPQLSPPTCASSTTFFFCLHHCQDFPLEMIQRAVSMLLVDDGLECRLPLADFTRAFKIQLVFNEWLDECRALFNRVTRARSLSLSLFLSLSLSLSLLNDMQ